jgi:hypothetical protein
LFITKKELRINGKKWMNYCFKSEITRIGISNSLLVKNVSQDMFQTISNGIKEQYNAAFEMLNQAVTDCSTELWNRQEKGPPFWQIAYHTLFFLDYYLGNSEEEKEKFKPFFPNSNGHRLDVRVTKGNPTRVQMLEYVSYVKAKAIKKFDEMTAETLVEETVFEWHGKKKFSTLIYNLRHAMLHIGALNSLLVRNDIKTTWVSKS